MEIHELNIENYINQLSNIRKDVDIDLKEIERKWLQSGKIISMLVDREYKKKGIIYNKETEPISTELIEKIRKRFFQLFEEVNRLRKFKDWHEGKKINFEYLLKEGKEIDFYLPNDKEIETIKYLKDKLLTTLKFDFKQVLSLLSLEQKNEIIDTKIKNLVYHYRGYYETGEMIIRQNSNEEIEFFMIADDWAKYDFTQYLKSERLDDIDTIIEKTEQSTKKLKWLASDYHLGFIIKELAEKGFIELPKNGKNQLLFTEFRNQILESFSGELNSKTLYDVIYPHNETNLSDNTKKMFQVPHYQDIINNKGRKKKVEN